MISFTLPYPQGKAKAALCRQFGPNAYYSGTHWSKRKQDAEVIHALTHRALHKAKVAKATLNCPVEVRFFWDDGLDIDNHAALGKMIVDVLKGYLLPDDDPRWFRKVTHEFWRGGAILVEVLPYAGPKGETEHGTKQDPL